MLNFNKKQELKEKYSFNSAKVPLNAEFLFNVCISPE